MEALRLPDGRAIPEQELQWTFTRAHGPGGQAVNTTDSAVRLSWDLATTRILTEEERERAVRRLAARMHGTEIVVTAREHRSQWANRRAAAERLLGLVGGALAPGPKSRRATAPSRAQKQRRRTEKRRHAEVKQLRRRPAGE